MKTLRTISEEFLLSAERMSILLTIVLGFFSAIPFVIAMKRKHANMILLAVLDLFLSWTIIGWFVVLAWAIWGESDPKEYAKQSGAM